MILRFDDFEVDEERFELRRDGVVAPVQPRVFDLLRVLARRPNVIVSRAELLELVWSGVNVTNDALAQAVMTLRKTLGDNGETPTYVETVRGRGYRFLGSVTTRPAEVAALADVAPVSRAPTGHSTPASTFVAHGPKLALVAERLGRGGSVVLVTADAGGGKTRFLEELAARVPGVVRARSAPEAAPELWLFTQVLRELRRRGTPLQGTLAEVADGSYDATALDDARVRFALCDSLVAMFESVSRASPLLVAADDLHAESARTLSVLELMAERMVETNTVLCATVTPSASATPALKSFLGVMSRNPAVSVLRLEPFTLAEVGAYLEAESGASPFVELVAKIHHKTGGNVLLLAQLAQRPKVDWLREPNVRTGSLADVASLREAIAYQLRSLPADVASVVTMAAVLGSKFTVAPLSAALGLTNAETLSALDAATAARVLGRTAIAHYHFAVPLVRDVLHEQLSAVARARLHGLAAHALEAHLGDSQDHVRVAEVAAHFVEAAATGDVEEAVDWSLRAAELADAAGDRAAARAIALRGLVAIELAPVPDVAKRARLRSWTG